MCELDDVISTLAKESFIGRSHLQSWWFLSLTLDRKPALLQKAPIFLGLTLKAHVNEAWMTLAKLYDKRKDAMTMGYAMKLGQQNAGKFKDASPEEARKLLERQEAEVQRIHKQIENKSNGVKAQRDNYIAHLKVGSTSPGGGMSTLKTMVGNPKNLLDELDGLYERTEAVLNKVRKAYSGTGIPDFEGNGRLGCHENSEICSLLG